MRQPYPACIVLAGVLVLRCPVELWGSDGYRRTQVNFSAAIPANRAQFRLPGDCRGYQLDVSAP